MNRRDEHPDRIWQGTSHWFHANSAVLNETYGVVFSYGIYRGSLLRIYLLSTYSFITRSDQWSGRGSWLRLLNVSSDDRAFHIAEYNDEGLCQVQNSFVNQLSRWNVLHFNLFPLLNNCPALPTYAVTMSLHQSGMMLSLQVYVYTYYPSILHREEHLVNHYKVPLATVPDVVC